MSDIQNIVRDRIAQGYMKGNAAPKASETPPKKAKPLPMFLDEVEVDEGTVMYSDSFTGAADYIKTTGLPDINITRLVHQREDWTDALQLLIPELDEHYKWQHKVLYPALQALIGNLTVLSVGPTGSGKTTFWQNMSAVFNQPFYRLGGRGDMESDDIIGRPDMQNGSMTYLLGEFPKHYAAGCMCLLDEPWKLPANINMVFQRVFERKGILQIDGMPGTLADKQISPDVRTHLVLADNVVGTGDGADKYSATMIQDGSTLNRMDMILHIGYMDEQDEVDMVQSRFSFVPDHIALKSVQVANLVRSAFELGQVSATMSPRNLIAWMELAGKVRSYEEAFKWTMLERFADSAEKETVKSFWSQAFGNNI